MDGGLFWCVSKVA